MMVRLTIGFLLSIAAATAAHAIPQDTDPIDLDPKPTAFAVGPAYIFGTHNTKMTVLKLDRTGSKLCSPDLSGCRPASGMDALFRAQQIQVTQLLKWDRSGVFALNATEMIACFAYFDSPGGAYFSCQTAARPSTTSNYVLSQALTTLALRTYSGAGLQPQSASRQNALYQKRKSTTAYAQAYGTLPPDRMKALSTEDDPVPATTSTEPPPADVLFEMVEITAPKSVETAPTPTAPPGLIFMSAVTITSPAPGVTPAIILDGCVTFQVCSAPPPPPSAVTPPPPPKVCQAQCQAVSTSMAATCSGATVQLATTLGIIVPVGSLIATVVASPAMGTAFFKTATFTSGAAVGALAGACKALNDASLSQCLAKAQQNGC